MEIITLLCNYIKQPLSTLYRQRLDMGKGMDMIMSNSFSRYLEDRTKKLDKSLHAPGGAFVTYRFCGVIEIFQVS